MADYTIWTDGGCAQNPNGKGGYGVVIQNNNDMTVKTYSEGFKSSTNNRMEVRAIIRALEEIPDGVSAVVFSDSKYAVFTFNGEYKKKKNLDLWPIAEALIARKSNVVFEWVKGHAENENNNICDELATQAQQFDDSLLIDDVGFVPIDTSGYKRQYKPAEPAKDIPAAPPTVQAMNVVIEPLIPDAYVNEACLQSICQINAKLKPTFADFAKLHVGGKDFWSIQPFVALQFYFGNFATAYVSDYFEDDEKAILSALRWFGRGLKIEYAIRKVLVDKEINEKSVKYNG